MAEAHVRTWDGGGGGDTNWNTALNWSDDDVPDTVGESALFDATSSNNCTVNVAVNIGGIDIQSGYGGTISGGSVTIDVDGAFSLAAGTFTSTSGLLSVSGAFTHSGGTFTHNSGTVLLDGAVAQQITTTGSNNFFNLTVNKSAETATAANALDVDGAFTLSSGTFAPSTYTHTVAGNWDDSGGTFAPTAGTVTLDGAGAQSITTSATNNFFNLTVAKSGGAATFSTGTLYMGSGASKGTLSVTGGEFEVTGGTLTWDGSAEWTFSVTGGTLDIRGGTIERVDASGIVVSSAATLAGLRSVTLQSFASGTAEYVDITQGALNLSCPGVKFGSGPTNNVKLRTAGGGQPVLTFEDRDDATNGPLRGESNDDDEDDGSGAGTADDGIISGSETANGGVVQWVYTAASDPFDDDANSKIVGFPTLAVDWSSAAPYAVYVAYTVAGGTDRVYKRDFSGDPVASYSIVDGDGDITGQPLWDTINEPIRGFDANGDGDQLDTNVHVVWVATTGGKVFMLYDNGSTLALPAAGSWSSAFSNAAVVSITSPLMFNDANVYFGGTTTSSDPRFFAVQISDKTLARNIDGPPSVITTQPSSVTYDSIQYFFMGSDIDTVPAPDKSYVYRINFTDTSYAQYDTGGTANHVRGGTGLIAARLHVGDLGGQMHGLQADDVTPTVFEPLSGTWPFVGTGAINSRPFIDVWSYRVYYGDADGDFHTLASNGALVANYPFKPSDASTLFSATAIDNAADEWIGVIAVGDAGGKVYIIDESDGSSMPNVFKVYDFGSGRIISDIGYNGSNNTYIVGTDLGEIFFVTAPSDPTP